MNNFIKRIITELFVNRYGDRILQKITDERIMRAVARPIVQAVRKMMFYAEKDGKFLKDAPEQLKNSARRVSSEFSDTLNEAKKFFRK